MRRALLAALLLALPAAAQVTVEDGDGTPSAEVERIIWTGSGLFPNVLWPSGGDLGAAHVRHFEAPMIRAATGRLSGDDVAEAWGCTCWQVRIAEDISGAGVGLGHQFACNIELVAGWKFITFCYRGDTTP